MGWRVRRGRRSSRIKAERRRGGLRGHHPFPRPRALGSLLLSPLRDPGRAYSLWSLTRHGDEGKWGEEGKEVERAGFAQARSTQKLLARFGQTLSVPALRGGALERGLQVCAHTRATPGGGAVCACGVVVRRDA